MIEKLYRFSCVECPTVKLYSDRAEARSWGWAIARDKKTCYCPACALKHRSTGVRAGSAISGEQLKIGAAGNE